MLKKILTLAGLAALAALLMPSTAEAYGAAHVGYTHVGPNGVYHTGETAVSGPGGTYEAGRTAAYGAGGGAYHAGYGAGAGYGGAAGGYHYNYGYAGGAAAGGYHYGTAGGAAVGGAAYGYVR
jgi:hypothetical protein